MTDSIYGTWYTLCDQNVIAYSGNKLLSIKNNDGLIYFIVLTDTTYKSNAAYSFLKELSKEVYKEVPQFKEEYETMPNLN